MSVGRGFCESEWLVGFCDGDVCAIGGVFTDLLPSWLLGEQVSGCLTNRGSECWMCQSIKFSVNI